MLLKDVGHAELGAENYNTSLRYAAVGVPQGDAIGVGVQQLSNANALDVDRKCKEVFAPAREGPPRWRALSRWATTVVADSIRGGEDDHGGDRHRSFW